MWHQFGALAALTATGAATVHMVPLTPEEAKAAADPSAMPTVRQVTPPVPPVALPALRSAIVGAAEHFLKVAAHRTPAEMEAMIWRHASLDGADHGESCAAFATVALEMGARAAGEKSWITGGSTYPWPVHDWATPRVDPNPASPAITSLLGAAEAAHRWHPLGDGYHPRPGDFVLFDQHVEVVTGFHHDVLSTIGGDSLPNFSVNAHTYAAPLGAEGVAGFVDNGAHGPATPQASHPEAPPAAAHPAPDRTDPPPAATEPATPPAAVSAAADIPGLPPAGAPVQVTPAADTKPEPARPAPTKTPAPVGETPAERAFIDSVAPAAIKAQERYGVPASVTIAQAIIESGWGDSRLATVGHALFGIKGRGPAGIFNATTEEFLGGTWVKIDASFREYHTAAQSIDDHGRLLATNPRYAPAMAARAHPDAFAHALSGVYATDPEYGHQLVHLMRHYDLYRYTPPPAQHPAPGAVPDRPSAVPAPTSDLAEVPGVPGGAVAPAAPRPPVVAMVVDAPAGEAAVPGLPIPSPAAGAAAIPGVPVAPAPPVPQAQNAIPDTGHRLRLDAAWYQPAIAASAQRAYTFSAKLPITRSTSLYKDVALATGVPWQLLAACDWMQCGANRGRGQHGEKLGRPVNGQLPCHTKSEALGHIAQDLLARAAHGYGITVGPGLTVTELARVFAAYRWSEWRGDRWVCLLAEHHTSAMEFPYSVAGLTEAHTAMRWPAIPAATGADTGRSGIRLGAVPLALLLGYRARQDPEAV